MSYQETLQGLLQSSTRVTKSPTTIKDGGVKASVSVTTSQSSFDASGNRVVTEKELKNDKVEVERKLIAGRAQYVSVDYGATINMSNYNSAKINVSVSSPVGAEFTDEVVGAIKKTINDCRKIAEEFVSQEVSDLKKSIGR